MGNTRKNSPKWSEQISMRETSVEAIVLKFSQYYWHKHQKATFSLLHAIEISTIHIQNAI